MLSDLDQYQATALPGQPMDGSQQGQPLLRLQQQYPVALAASRPEESRQPFSVAEAAALREVPRPGQGQVMPQPHLYSLHCIASAPAQAPSAVA